MKDNYRRGDRRTAVYYGVGFRVVGVNGVWRSGSWFNVSVYSRSGFRVGIYEKSFLWGAVGFRVEGVNGDVRSIRVNNSNNANASRCSSRYGGQKRTWVNGDVGFRLSEWCDKRGQI